MRKLFFCLAIVSIVFISCSKGSDDDQGLEYNTWTFKAEGTTYQGDLYWDPLLNTFLQSNDTYTFTMLGGEPNTNRVFNIIISLADTTFEQKNYQSGDATSDHITSFSYRTELVGESIYRSDNHTINGPVMNYTIESYNPSTRELVLNFSGNAENENGVDFAITEGKVRCKVEKF